MSLDEDKEFEHPSYGMVVLTRRSCSGGNRLFGSHLNSHHQTIGLTIKRGVRRHHLASDWFHGREQLIEIELSAAQFADLLTNMNVGDGVPCTIRWISGQGSMPDVPADEQTEVQMVTEDYKAELLGLRKKLQRFEKQAEEILEKKSLSKDDRKQLLGLVSAAGRFLWDHSTFVMDQFKEAAGKVVTSAKAEVEATFSSMVRSAGLEALVNQGKLSAPTIPQLSAGDPVDAEFTEKP